MPRSEILMYPDIYNKNDTALTRGLYHVPETLPCSRRVLGTQLYVVVGVVHGEPSEMGSTLETSAAIDKSTQRRRQRSSLQKSPFPSEMGSTLSETSAAIDKSTQRRRQRSSLQKSPFTQIELTVVSFAAVGDDSIVPQVAFPTLEIKQLAPDSGSLANDALMVEETKIVSQLLRSFNEMIAATLPSFQQPQQDRPPSMATQTVDPVAKSDVIGDDQTPRRFAARCTCPCRPLPPPSFPNSSFVQGSESSSPSPHPGPQQFHPGPSVPRASDADPHPPPHSRPAQGGDLGLPKLRGMFTRKKDMR
ncbi:hypothetical protein R3P38DRAFT_2771170 [Favolaschia claudopus]|uniref:Uncharacterized protein n=1 Tax=Favolaschia claudopus TaxID=2862362 RepID=A0AAW0CE45_9AGAR